MPTIDKKAIDAELLLGINKYRDIQALKEYLDAGGDPNAPLGETFSGMTGAKTIFDLVVRTGDLGLVRTLFTHGKAKITIEKDQKDEDGKTALHHATIAGNLGTAKFLLENERVNINTADLGLETSLHYAARAGDDKMVKYLISKGAQHSGNKLGFTPSHLAAREGHLDVLKTLIASRASTSELKNIFYHAILNRHTELVEYLIEAMAEEINQPLSNTYSPLEFAIECGMEARVVKAFVAAGANIRHTITSGYGSPIDNALTLAIKRGDLDLVTFLVETDQKKKNEEELALDKRQNLSPVLAAGALDFQDRLGRTPLILALTLGLTDIAKFLIGIDLENRTKSRMFYRDNLEKYKEHLIQSALDNNRIDSKRSRSPELFLILQNAGIVFSQDLLEQALKYRCSAESIREIIRIVGTPSNIHNCLEIALSSYRGCKDADMEAIIAVFIEAGLDINQQDEKGDTILSRYISEFSNSRIVKTLLRCGADPNIANNYGEIPLNKATMGANFNQEICQTLLAKTSIDSLNKVDSHGCTIFHHLANFLDDSSALFMTACQARKDSKHIKFNQAGANKETPLFQAALRGNCAIYDILMRTDEDAVNKVTKNGRTILHAAALGGNIKIIESALKYSKGATPLDINARDSEGKTALSLAIKAGNIIAINALLEAGADYDLLEIKRVLSEASKFRNKEAEKLLEIFETQSKSERRIRDMVINLAQKLATEKDRGEIDKESTALSLEALDSLRERIFCGIELCPFNEHPIAFVTNSGTYSYNNNTAGTRSLMHNPSTREPILARVKDLNVGDATKHIKTSAAKLYATLIYGCVKSRDVKTAEKYLADSLNEYDIKLFDILEYLEVLIKETHEEKVARLLLEIKELGTPPPSLSHDGVLMEDPVMTILTGSGVSVERKYVESNTQYFPPKCNPNPNPGAKFPTNFTLKNITEAYGKYQSAALRFFDRELQKIEKPSATTMTRSDGAAAMDEKTLLR